VQAHSWWVMKLAGKHRDHYFCRWQAKIVTKIIFFLKKMEKKKVPRIARLGEKIDQKNILTIPRPPHMFLFCFWKTRKVLRIAWFGEKIDQKNILNFFFEKKEKFLELSDLVRNLIRQTFW
jgi:hypothetical protein